MKRVVTALVVLGVFYISVLFFGGLFAGGCVADSVEAKLGRALAADVEVEDAAVFVATGKVSLGKVTATRDGVSIVIEHVEVSMAPGGLMLVSQDLEQVVVRSVSAELSARGVVALAMKEREPLHIDELIIEDANVSISPTLIIPGLGRVDAAIESARANNVELSSAVSWIADLEEMVARADLPGGAGVEVTYRGGKLGLSGSWFGSNPLSIPFEIPELSPELLEIEQLTILGKALVKAVAKHVATDRLFDAAKDLFD